MLAHTFDVDAAMALLAAHGFVAPAAPGRNRRDDFSEFEAALRVEFAGRAVRHRFF